MANLSGCYWHVVKHELPTLSSGHLLCWNGKRTIIGKYCCKWTKGPDGSHIRENAFYGMNSVRLINITHWAYPPVKEII